MTLMTLLGVGDGDVDQRLVFGYEQTKEKIGKI